MAFDLWTYQFCLACDKQVQSDAATYCSEPCQMIDSERSTLRPSSQESSPGFPPPPTEFYVSWAYGLSTARSCETTAQKRHWIHYMMPDTEQPWLHADRSCIMSMYTSNGGPEADWEVYATTENATRSKLARRATYNHNTYLTTPPFSATFTATRW
ncbi:uncharacterized protein BKA55DRAFT_624746 [Fusarium redolens]|uniref:Uncharacterized protein n=1 Tax=Fusarium redolens TaxID=48865 RepID=A0A9P9G1U6_FUSRE|nr:uncharacterized protein BKA55DRAFT_624746 [Fusarium redolens]KAH7231604.1 hypothetical protein BKA55DRAFT_624746 [Fusarium redolens]